MLILFIDDSQTRHNTIERYFGKEHTVLHTYDYEETVKTITSCKNKIGLAMFDHDLGDYSCPNCSIKLTYKVSPGGIIDHPRSAYCFDCKWKYGDDGVIAERTGDTIVRHMIEFIPEEKWPATAIVHSHNGDRAKYMVNDLTKAGIFTRRLLYSTDMIQALALELAEQ
jgi:hypothetical protein